MVSSFLREAAEKVYGQKGRRASDGARGLELEQMFE